MVPEERRAFFSAQRGFQSGGNDRKVGAAREGNNALALQKEGADARLEKAENVPLVDTRLVQLVAARVWGEGEVEGAGCGCG